MFFARLIEFVLPYVISMVHKREILNSRECVGRGRFIAHLVIRERKTKKPVVVALIGSTDSGKRLVVEGLAKQIGATIIWENAIRAELQKQGVHNKGVHAIAEDAAIEIVEKGGTVILNFNAIEMRDRAILRAKARKAGVRLVFVRTYCEPETEKPPCDVLANINTKYEEYWIHEVGTFAKELLA